MSLKNYIKEIPFFYQANSNLKARLQERKAANELDLYQNNASVIGKTLQDNNATSQLLKERLAKRGIHPFPKNKGELHIFLTYPLNNWEAVLPTVLKPFGRISEFEWGVQGLKVKSKNWIDHRNQMNRMMLEYFHKVNSDMPVDVIVAYLSGYGCDPRALNEMGQSGAIIFNFCWDDKLGFRGEKIGGRWSGPATLASVVDLNLTNAPESRIKYLVEGGLAMFWPEAANPNFHKPYELPFEYDVSVVGGNYGWRPSFVAKLRNMGIEVTCFGRGWPNGSLTDEETVKLYSRSKIILGFAGVGHSKKLMCIKGRDFEVPMSGGLYLTQKNPELSFVYEVGKEILTYEDEIDCAQKIHWLLENPTMANTIRKAGRTRALEDHTWGKRFDNIFKLSRVME